MRLAHNNDMVHTRHRDLFELAGFLIIEAVAIIANLAGLANI
jgi:hypothetical protein